MIQQEQTEGTEPGIQKQSQVGWGTGKRSVQCATYPEEQFYDAASH